MRGIEYIDIILEALWDYSKWFEDDPENQASIKSAIAFVKNEFPLISQSNTGNDKFPITAVSRADIVKAFDGHSRIKEVAMSLKDHQMEYLAAKLADDYCEQLFWRSLRNIFTNRFLKPLEVRKYVEHTNRTTASENTGIL